MSKYLLFLFFKYIVVSLDNGMYLCFLWRKKRKVYIVYSTLSFMKNIIQGLEEERKKWEEREVQMKENAIVLAKWKADNFEAFNELLEFKIFVLENNYSHGGKIMVKESGKVYIFEEWGRDLRSACKRALNNVTKIRGYGTFKSPLMRTFLEDWINEQEKMINNKQENGI